MGRPEQTETVVNYLRDLGYLVREAAVEARDRSQASAGDGFEVGRAAAYHEVASLMESQARSFGLDLSALAFDGFDPDRDLLSTP